MFKNTLIVILAGGKSSRMGKNKLYIDYNGLSFLDYNILKFRGFGFKNIIVSGKIENYPSISDDFIDMGPLSGIYTIIFNKISLSYKYVLFVPVDMPFLNKNVIFNMLNNYNYFDIVIYNNYSLPILVNLSKNVKFTLKKIFKDSKINKLSINSFIEMSNVLKKRLDSFEEKVFLNVNYQHDLDKLKFFNTK